MATHRTFASFDRAVNRHWDRYEEVASLVVNGITFKLYGWIVEGTRVDTGRMRAGWMIAIEQPTSEQPGSFSKTSPPQAEQYAQILDAAPLTAKRVIFNNVEYVTWWEFGTDTRDGDHMVELAVQRLISEAA